MPKGETMNRIKQIDLKQNGQNRGFEIISLKNFFESVDKPFIKTPYRTSFYNLIFITKGKGIHEVDFLEYPIKAGELLMISRNRVHRYKEFQTLEGYLIMFTEGFMCEFLSNQTSEVKELFNLSYLNPHINSLDLYTETLIPLLKVLHNMYKNSYNFVDNKVIASAFNAFVQIISNSRLGEGISKYKKNETFVNFTELVEKNINSIKTVKEYADMMYTSKKTVNLMTRKAIDMSAKQYIIQQLILKIRLKLSFEQKSINEIAFELGFTDPSNMTRFFKKNTGISPNEFRKKVSHSKDSWSSNDSSELEGLVEAIEKKTYHISSEVIVPLHKHEDLDEIFYCIKGSGFGVLEDSEVTLEVGDTFVVPAKTLHSLRTDKDLYVAAILIPVEKIICHCKQVSFRDIKKAMVNGARTIEEIKEITGAGTGCGGCIEDIEKILSVACGCKNVSVEAVVQAVRNGADTVEQIGEVTEAGTGCGRCKALLQNIIDTKKYKNSSVL